MSASAAIPCAADTWVKVATGVTSATIHKLITTPSLYKQTHVPTTDPAPTNDSNAINAFAESDSFIFTDSVLSDVYLKAVKYAGSVRVDL